MNENQKNVLNEFDGGVNVQALESQKELIRLATEIGTRAGIIAFQEENRKLQQGRYDRRLRNTKLLLKNYRTFKESCSNAVYEASQIQEKPIDIIDLMWNPCNSGKLSVESIKNSAQRTYIIMAHIDEMISIYKTMCDKSAKPEDKRRYRVLIAMYISDDAFAADEIAQIESIDIRTIYKDIDIACEKMSSLIFGVDFLNQRQ